MSVQLPVQLHLRLEFGDTVKHLFDLVQELTLAKQVAALQSHVCVDGL